MHFLIPDKFSRPFFKGRLIIFAAIISLFIGTPEAFGHPMPNSVVLLDIKPHEVTAELQLPLSELELAFGHEVNLHTDGLVQRLGPQLNAYLMQHIHPVGMDGKAWSVKINDMLVQPVQQSASGPYKELTVYLTLLPAAGASTRKFIFNYDAIIHQVSSHFALVSVRQDWDNGLSADHPYQVGVARLNIRDNKIYPLEINIQEGNLWIGFTNMVSLGIDHIKEGTDHLLFLLTLLLPANLIARNKQWQGFAGTRASLVNILKIVSAFTMGHSVTLIIGALGIFHFPGRIIEVLIALSILVSAIHALKPIFPGKEMYIAAGFGLIHGMAFAETLINLNLDGLRMTLSILGFNLGIELMQLFVIAVTIPWLIILCRNNIYNGLRIFGSLFTGIAAIAWMIERISGQSNFITKFIASATQYSQWLIVALAVAAMLSYIFKKRFKAATV
jgi:HupE / UreJ protein